MDSEGFGKARVVVRIFFKTILFLVSLDFVLAGAFLLWKSFSPLSGGDGSDGSGLMGYPLFLASELPAVLSLMATGVAMFLLLYFINKFSEHKRFVIGLLIGLLIVAFLIFLTINTFNTFFSSFGFKPRAIWEILLFKPFI